MPFLIDLAGCALTPTEKRWLEHDLVGGVVLFARNYATRSQITTLIQMIRLIRPHLLIAVDQEGGRVQRFREEFTALSPLKALGDCYERDAHEGLCAAREHATTMAQELRSVGVDFSFAPVVDCLSTPSSVVGDRAFSKNIATVVALTLEYAKTLQQCGMPVIAKHFPGHGGVVEDSHVMLPVDARDYVTLAAVDMQPYQKLIEAHTLSGVMTAHVCYPQCDPAPATFSSFWIKTVLKERLHFKGVVFSDDLMMQGAATHVPDVIKRITHAHDAGCHFILLCNHPEVVTMVLKDDALYHRLMHTSFTDRALWRYL